MGVEMVRPENEEAMNTLCLRRMEAFSNRVCVHSAVTREVVAFLELVGCDRGF